MASDDMRVERGSQDEQQDVGRLDEATAGGDVRVEEEQPRGGGGLRERIAKKIEDLRAKREESGRVKELAKALDEIGRERLTRGDVWGVAKRMVPAVVVGAGSVAGGAAVVEGVGAHQVDDVEAQEGQQYGVWSLVDVDLTPSELESVRDDEIVLESGSDLSEQRDRFVEMMGDMAEEEVRLMVVYSESGLDGGKGVQGMMFLEIEADEVEINDWVLNKGSIVFEMVGVDGSEDFGYMMPVEVEGYGMTRPVLMPMGEDLRNYLLSLGLQIPPVDDWVAMTVLDLGGGMMRPVTLGVYDQNGIPLGLVISQRDGREAPSVAAPTSPASGEGEGGVRLVGWSGEGGVVREREVAELSVVLGDWLSGVTELEDERRFRENGERLMLGVFPEFVARKDLDNFPGRLVLMGKILAMDEVDEHLIVYMGFEDRNGGRFYVPFDFGRLGEDGFIVSLFPQITDSIFPSGNRTPEQVRGGQQLRNRIMELGLLGDVVMFSIFGEGMTKIKEHVDISSYPVEAQEMVDESILRVSEQIELVREFEDFMYRIQSGEVTARDVGEWANGLVESYDPKELMVSWQIDYRTSK